MSEPTSAQPPAPATDATKNAKQVAPAAAPDAGATATDTKAVDSSDVKAGCKPDDDGAPAATDDAVKPNQDPTGPTVDKSDKGAGAEAKNGTSDTPPAQAPTNSNGGAEGAQGSKPDSEDKAAQREEVGTDADNATEGAEPAKAAGPPATPLADKSKARRKSASLGESKKKLNKKGSRARITHLDAKPGDHYFVKLKGYPRWPIIICDEEMLPENLLKSRPVTAARPDGTYREDFADGGKKAHDRTYPVMYLHTNEFGWVPNTDLVELDPKTVPDLISDKMRKDLQAAHQLASESHDLEYYKDLLLKHQEEVNREEEALKEKEEAALAKKEAKALAAANKAKEDADGDLDMPDADEIETPIKEKKPSSSKKRKAEEEAATPQRSDSVKKPKIKLTTNSTPKPANGVSTTPKAVPAKVASEAKPKPKAKKPAKETEEKKVEEPAAPKEPELSPEEKHARKEKEVLFLRHKLQKGLLTRDQEPKEEEMKNMSEYITKLEGFPDLEVNIIRVTKINKVLKAILKLESIPKEDEFKFKSRSQVLLDKWNKLMSSGDGGANGVNGASKKEKDTAAAKKSGSPSTAAAAANGVKTNGDGKKATASAEAKDDKKLAAASAAESEPKEGAEKEANKPAETAESTA